MTTMRDILSRAVRRTRAVQLGDAPSGDELDAALVDAQSLFMTLTARGLTEVLVSTDYEAGEDERVIDSSGTATITRPTSITENNVARPPRNGAIVEVAGATPRRDIYVGEYGAWKRIDSLTLTSAHPFGPSLDDAVVDMIAVRIISTVYQADPGAMLVALGQQGRDAFEARFMAPIIAQVDHALRATGNRYTGSVI